MNEACDKKMKTRMHFLARYIDYCRRKTDEKHAIEVNFHYGKGLLVAIKGRQQINVGLVNFELKV